MAKLTPDSQTLAMRLLAWDRARVGRHAAEGHDVAAYRARQDLAEAAIGSDVAGWPDEVRDLFMAVLEVTRATSVTRRAISPKPHDPPAPEIKRIVYGLALEIGALARLREVCPEYWGEMGETDGCA